MELVEEKIGEVHILKLSNRLDATCAVQLKDVVLAMIDADKLKILIDLAEVEFVDSSGLGTLVTCLRSVGKAGGVFKISSLPEHPKHLFETTRLDRVFDMYDDRGTALQSF